MFSFDKRDCHVMFDCYVKSWRWTCAETYIVSNKCSKQKTLYNFTDVYVILCDVTNYYLFSTRNNAFMFNAFVLKHPIYTCKLNPIPAINLTAFKINTLLIWSPNYYTIRNNWMEICMVVHQQCWFDHQEP